MKVTLVFLGLLAIVFILAQLVMGQLMVDGGRRDLLKAHQHTGYSAVVLSLIYVGLSLRAILGVPTRAK